MNDDDMPAHACFCMHVPLNKTGSYISDTILRYAGDFVAVTGYVRMEGGSGDEFVGLLEEKSQGKVKHGDVILMVIHPTVNNSNDESHSPPKKTRLVPNYEKQGWSQTMQHRERGISTFSGDLWKGRYFIITCSVGTHDDGPSSCPRP